MGGTLAGFDEAQGRIVYGSLERVRALPGYPVRPQLPGSRARLTYCVDVDVILFPSVS